MSERMTDETFAGRCIEVGLSLRRGKSGEAAALALEAEATRARSEEARLRALVEELAETLHEARGRLHEHHEASYALAWGERCRVCVNSTDKTPGGVFDVVDRALSKAREVKP